MFTRNEKDVLNIECHCMPKCFWPTIYSDLDIILGTRNLDTQSKDLYTSILVKNHIFFVT